jgi:hypothetical protein
MLLLAINNHLVNYCPSHRTQINTESEAILAVLEATNHQKFSLRFEIIMGKKNRKVATQFK